MIAFSMSGSPAKYFQTDYKLDVFRADVSEPSPTTPTTSENDQFKTER